MGNKIKYGLRNAHYAVVSENAGVVSYATPVAIPGAVSLKLDPEGDKVEFYADDSTYYTNSVNNGYSGDLEMALILDSFRTDVLGDTVDTNGALIENADAVSKNFALLYEFQGDANATRHVMYNVNAARPNLEGETKGKNIDPKTETLKITAIPASDTKDVKAKLKPTDTGYDTFYSAVYLKNAVTNTLAVSTGTFSKGAPANVTIDATSTDGTNTVKDVKKDGISIGGANMSYSGVDATILSAYLATLANAVYTITVEFVKGNAVTFTLTVTA